MTRQEFDAWLKWHATLFPEVRKWLNTLGDDGVPVVLAEWFNAMKHIKAEKMREITRAMLSGTYEHPDNFSISSLPAAIIAAAPVRIRSVEEINRRGPAQ